MRLATFVFVSLLSVAQSADAARVTGKEVVVGQPCEGCEHVFAGLPSQIPTTARLAPAAQPGEPLRLSGTVRNAAGVPQANVVIYAYQTDRGGIYPRAATRHGALRGWVRTDAKGKYAFSTIRPGAYPSANIPQHIHMHVIEPGRCTYYIGDVLFTDDPFLTASHRERERRARGGSGIVKPAGSKAGWTATRDITLGLNVPDHAGCAESRK